MATEQEIIDQITMTESALEKCDAEVHIPAFQIYLADDAK
jgi:hypothetical protein